VTKTPPHILVVDDDARLCDLIARYLGEQGFRVSTAANAAEARQKLAGFAFDLIVLDVMMPGESGLELTRSLRAKNSVPILLLTAMGESADRIGGLETGADDYLTKPFEPRELILRIQAILKRAEAQPRILAPSALLRFGPFRFEIDRRRLFRGTDPVYLTEAESAMLARLAMNVGQPVTRDELSALGESAANAQSRLVDVQITRLRRKIEDDPKFPRYLQTVRGRGYVLQPD